MSLLYVLHGVDAHFDFVAPPSTGTASFWGGSTICIGLSAPVAASSDVSLRGTFPVTMLSATIAWSPLTVTCFTTICC